MLTNQTSNNFLSRRTNNGGSSYTCGTPINSNFNMVTPPGNLFGIHSFQDGTAAHNFINAALKAGNYTGTVAAATSMAPGAMIRNIDSMRSYANNGTVNGRIQSGFPISCLGNPMSIHPVLPASSTERRRTRNSPCPASALILVVEVQDLPGHRRSSYHRSRYFGSPSSSSGFGSQSSQSSNSSSGSNLSCDCDECRHCICHLYCDEHAHRHCHVHGLGEPDTNGECRFPMASSEFDCRYSSSQDSA